MNKKHKRELKKLEEKLDSYGYTDEATLIFKLICDGTISDVSYASVLSALETIYARELSHDISIMRSAIDKPSDLAFV